MVTAYKTGHTANYSLFSFLKDIGCTEIQFKILCFWVRHSRAKLTLCTIAGALDYPRANLKDEISDLVKKGTLIVHKNSGGFTTYALSEKQMKEYIGELSDLDWTETRNLKNRLEQDFALSYD